MSGLHFSSEEWLVAHRILQASLDEDSAWHDVTGKLTVPMGQEAHAKLTAREAMTLSGVDCIGICLEALDAEVRVQALVPDGTQIEAGTTIANLWGSLRAILAAERSFLNIMGLLSGTATLTRLYVDAVGPHCKVLDTRKTIPGLRMLQKYAVRCGGGVNHRMGLADAYLIKDNHRWSGLVLGDAVALARSSQEELLLVVEVDDAEELDEALLLPVDRILLDNFSDEQLQQAIARRAELRSETPFELSGGIDLERARRVGQLGVEYISVGALTHSAPSADLGLDLAVDD